MKITETIERECCNREKDMKTYNGTGAPGIGVRWFCIHCGQLWGYGPIDQHGCESVEFQRLSDRL